MASLTAMASSRTSSAATLSSWARRDLGSLAVYAELFALGLEPVGHALEPPPGPLCELFVLHADPPLGRFSGGPYSAVRWASSLLASSMISTCTPQRKSASSSSWASLALLAAVPQPSARKQGVERLLGVVLCVVRHGLDHLAIWLLSSGRKPGARPWGS
jgi:hypothetical protein